MQHRLKFLAFYTCPNCISRSWNSSTERPERQLTSPVNRHVYNKSEGLECVKADVRKSRISGTATHARKFETTVVFNGYKNWTFTTTEHKLEVAKVRVLGADQKKSGLWGRDSVPQDRLSLERRTRRVSPGFQPVHRFRTRLALSCFQIPTFLPVRQ